MNEEGIGKHICKGIKNDEGQNGTIYNANNCMGNANSCTSNHTNYIFTTNDISTREMAKGAKARGTIDDISTREMAEGAKRYHR
jgi:hypothetical protein